MCKELEYKFHKDSQFERLLRLADKHEMVIYPAGISIEFDEDGEQQPWECAYFYLFDRPPVSIGNEYLCIQIVSNCKMYAYNTMAKIEDDQDIDGAIIKFKEYKARK